MLNLAPVWALRGFRRFLARWPDHPRAAEAQGGGAGTAADVIQIDASDTVQPTAL
jgi:hypothetical protein